MSNDMGPTSIDWNKQQKQNLEHADNPVVGDRWVERMALLFEVKSVTDNHVTLLGRTGMDRYTRAEFSKFVRYETNPGKTWVDVLPYCRVPK